MPNNEGLSTYDMVCRVFNPKYQPKRKGERMSRIKKYAEDELGEDWVHKLEDKEHEDAKRK